MKISFSIPREWWMSANRPITDHGYRARLRSNLHQLAMLRARQGHIPAYERAALTWEISYPKGTSYKTGDPTNAHPTTKALLDGLVKAGIFPDDSPAYITSETFTRGVNLTHRHSHTVTLHIHPTTEEVAA